MTACDCTTCAAVRAAERQCERADVLARALLEAGEQLRARDERIRALEEAAREAVKALGWVLQDEECRVDAAGTCDGPCCESPMIADCRKAHARLAALVTTKKGDDQ